MSTMRRANRLNKTAVRFTCRVKVVSLILPGVQENAGVFAIMERGKRHKAWSTIQPYVPHGSTPAKKAESVKAWANENLEIPVTLYRGAKGAYQPKPFKLKVMKDPSSTVYVAGSSSDNPMLACFTLDCAQFCVLDDVEEAKLVKVQAVKNGKSMLSAASAQLAVACVFSHDATYDAGSVASSGRTGTSFNSDEKELQSEFEQEQDLSGFDEDLDQVVIGPRSQWKKWWTSSSSRKGAADEHTYEHGDHGGSGGGGGAEDLSSIRGMEPLGGIAEVRESVLAEDGDESPNPLVAAPGSGQAGNNNSSSSNSSSRRGFGTLGSGLSSRSGSSKGASNSIRGLLFSGGGSSSGSGGSGGGGSSAEAKARAKAEKAASETAVAELLRSEGMPQLIGRVVIDLGFTRLDVLRSLLPHEYDAFARDANLTPGQATKLRLRLGIKRPRDVAAMDRFAQTHALDLVGKWVEVDGIGPGLVTEFRPVWNRVLYDSSHIVDFSASALSLPTSALFQISRSRRDKNGTGFHAVKLLLRRKKFARWNEGIGFEIIPDPNTT